MNLNALGGLDGLDDLGFDWGALIGTAAKTLIPKAIDVAGQRQVAKVYAKAGVSGPAYQPVSQPAPAPTPAPAPAPQPVYLPAAQPAAPAGMSDWAKAALALAAVVGLLLLLRAMQKRKR